jgi:hypothetical protein
MFSLTMAWAWTLLPPMHLTANNLLDKYYQLPLGGADYFTWKAAGSPGALGALPGMDRSVNAGLTVYD